MIVESRATREEAAVVGYRWGELYGWKNNNSIYFILINKSGGGIIFYRLKTAT